MYVHGVYKSNAFILWCTMIHTSSQLENLLIDFTKSQREKYDFKKWLLTQNHEKYDEMEH